MSDSEKESIEKEETIEKSNVSTDKHCESSSSFRKHRWSILAVTILAVAIGIHLMNVTRDKQELPTNGDHQDEHHHEATQIETFTAFTNGISEFASDFYQQSIRESNGDVVISPLSVASALGLLSLAGNGSTFEQIANGLHLTANKSAIGDNFFEYIAKFQPGPLAILNKIYVQESYEINDEFQNATKGKLSSGIESVNFGDSIETAQYINEFVERKTDNKIKDLIPPEALSSETRAIVVNTIIFKRKWWSEFNNESTREGDFHISESKTVPVDYMFQYELFNHAVLHDLDATAVQMKYTHPKFSFIIILPNAIDGLPALEAKLNQFNLTKIVDEFKMKYVHLTVPKFTIKFDIDLTGVLKNMGMTDMFTSKADFSGMLKSQKNDVPLYVSNVIHRTVIDVNEVGTEAYSATAPAIVTGHMNFEEAEFRADHPFFFYIWNSDTKTVIFSGRVTRFN